MGFRLLGLREASCCVWGFWGFGVWGFRGKGFELRAFQLIRASGLEAIGCLTPGCPNPPPLILKPRPGLGFFILPEEGGPFIVRGKGLCLKQPPDVAIWLIGHGRLGTHIGTHVLAFRQSYIYPVDYMGLKHVPRPAPVSRVPRASAAKNNLYPCTADGSHAKVPNMLQPKNCYPPRTRHVPLRRNL